MSAWVPEFYRYHLVSVSGSRFFGPALSSYRTHTTDSLNLRSRFRTFTSSPCPMIPSEQAGHWDRSLVLGAREIRSGVAVTRHFAAAWVHAMTQGIRMNARQRSQGESDGARRRPGKTESALCCPFLINTSGPYPQGPFGYSGGLRLCGPFQGTNRS